MATTVYLSLNGAREEFPEDFLNIPTECRRFLDWAWEHRGKDQTVVDLTKLKEKPCTNVGKA